MVRAFCEGGAARRVLGAMGLALVGLGCSAGGGNGPVEPPPTGPLAWYAFDEDVHSDASGNGFVASCEEPCPEVEPGGRVGGAAAFDGLSHLQVSDDDGALSTPEAWSVAAWVRLAELPGRVGVFTKVYREGPDNSWALTIDADGLPFCFTSNETADNTLWGLEPLELGRWYHLACTFDGATQRFYVDGEEVDSAGFVSAFDRGPVVIGGDIDRAFGFAMDGLVDEAVLYDVGLSSAQVRWLADGNGADAATATSAP